MLVRRLWVGGLCALIVFGFALHRAGAAAGDKQLARVKGIVGYKDTATSPFKAIFGRADLDDNAFAVTQANSQAILRLKDSSEIDIGEKTTVQVGEFNPAESGKLNSIAIQNGALHFNIRHPQGGQSNYQFTTPTSQIAVRGTEAFIVVGSQGTQVVCVACAAGDMSVTTGTQTITLVTGQAANIAGSSFANASLTVSSNVTVNNPAINALNNGSNPFGPSTLPPADPTGSLISGNTGAIGGSALGTVAAGGAVAGGVVGLANNSGGGGHASPSPSPTASGGPTPPPPPGQIGISANFSTTAFVSYPQPFTMFVGQNNATTALTMNATPANVVTCCSITQTSAPPSLLDTVTGTVNAPGTWTISASASGISLAAGLVNFTFYGAVSANPTSLSWGGGGGQRTLGTAQTVTVTQLPTGTQLTETSTCSGGAAITVTPSSGPSPLTLSVIATAAPTSPVASSACTITVTGQGTGSAAMVQIPINITSTGIGVSGHTRSSRI